MTMAPNINPHNNLEGTPANGLVPSRNLLPKKLRKRKLKAISPVLAKTKTRMELSPLQLPLRLRIRLLQKRTQTPNPETWAKSDPPDEVPKT